MPKAREQLEQEGQCAGHVRAMWRGRWERGSPEALLRPPYPVSLRLPRYCCSFAFLLLILKISSSVSGTDGEAWKRAVNKERDAKP